MRRDIFDGRSENEVIECEWIQVDPKIKNVFKRFSITYDFFDLLKLIHTLQNHFWIGHFSVVTSMSAPMKLSTQLRLTALKFTSELAIKEREF